MTDNERKELLSKAKPILFNTDMVRAILDGRKTVTRRAIKLKYDNTHIKIHKDKYGKRLVEIQNNVEGETYGVRPDGTHYQKVLAILCIARNAESRNIVIWLLVAVTMQAMRC